MYKVVKARAGVVSPGGVSSDSVLRTRTAPPVKQLHITPHTRKGLGGRPCIPLPLLQPVWQASIAIDRHNSPMADPGAWLLGRVCIRHCTGRVSQSRYQSQPGSPSPSSRSVFLFINLPIIWSSPEPPHLDLPVSGTRRSRRFHRLPDRAWPRAGRGSPLAHIHIQLS